MANALAKDIAAQSRRRPPGGVATLNGLLRLVAEQGMMIDSLVATVGHLEDQIFALRTSAQAPATPPQTPLRR